MWHRCQTYNFVLYYFLIPFFALIFCFCDDVCHYFDCYCSDNCTDCFKSKYCIQTCFLILEEGEPVLHVVPHAGKHGSTAKEEVMQGARKSDMRLAP